MHCAPRLMAGTDCLKPASSPIQRSPQRQRRSEPRSSCIVPGSLRSNTSTGSQCDCPHLRSPRRPPMQSAATRPTSRARSTASTIAPRLRCWMVSAARPNLPPGNSASPQLRDLLSKVELQEDAEFTELWPRSAGGAVELHLRDGAVRSHRCPHPPGSPQFALTDDELATKFHKYADPVLGSNGALELRQAVSDLEACDDLREFTRLLTRHPVQI